jgi:autotransporter-associated beta strand protein
MRRSRAKRQLVIAAISAFPLIALHSEPAEAGVYYWDLNGSTGGSGATPNGTWNTTDTNWNTVSTGLGATTSLGADTAVTARFSAGTDAVNPYSVTVDGTQNVVQMVIEEAAVATFSGGTLNFINAAGANSILTGATGSGGTNTVINSQITGANGFTISRTTGSLGNIVTIGSTANSFTGGVRVNADNTLRLGASGVIADGNLLTLGTNGALSLNGFDETIASISAAASAALIALGANTLTLASPAGESYVGQLTASSGGKIVKNGTGLLTLSGVNAAFLGEFVLNDGTVGIANQSAFGTSAGAQLTLNGGKLSNTSASGRTFSANLQVNLGASPMYDNSINTGPITFAGPSTIKVATSTVTVGTGASLTFDGAIGQDSAAGLTKAGDGSLTFTNAGNSYSGSTTISAGTLNIDADATLGNGAGTLVLAGGRLNTTAGRGVVAAPVANPIDVTLNSSITTTSSATAVDLNISSSTVGGIGTLTFQNNGADAATDVFQPRFAGSGVNFNPPAIDLQNGATGLTQLQSFNASGTTQTFANVISGNGSYRRASTAINNGGDSIFTAANTYSGGAVVADGGIGFGVDSLAGVSGPIGIGTLKISPPTAPTAGVNAKIFASGGARTISNAVVFEASPLLVIGSNALTMSGTVNLGGATRTIQVDNTAATEFSNVISNGGITKTGAGTVIFSGSNTYLGSTSISAGTLRTTGAGTLGAAGGNVLNDATLQLYNNNTVGTVDGTGTTTIGDGTNAALVSVTRFRQSALTVNAGATGQVAQAADILTNAVAASTSVVTSLTMSPTGKLNLTNNRIVTDSAQGVLTGSTYDGVQGMVQTGLLGAAGIVTDEPLAAANQTAIGVATAAEAKSLGVGATTMWSGQVVDSSDTLVMYTWAGDANLDGKVNADDYASIDLYSTIPGSGSWNHGDFNYSGTINADDYALIDNNVQNINYTPYWTTDALRGVASGSTASPTASLTAVPEPALSVISLTFLPLMQRRRRDRNLMPQG